MIKFLICSLLLATLSSVSAAEPVRVIFETDFTFDVDDVGALATLHALADNGEARILGVSYNEVHKDGVHAIDAVNTWYGRGDLPIGTYSKVLAKPDQSGYLTKVAERYPSDGQPKTSSLELYTRLLEEQPDQSVVVASVGFTNNLFDLLKNSTTRQLVENKVRLLVLMGGPRNDGFNLFRHETSDEADFVIRHWPSRIVFSFEGSRTCTGNGLLDTPHENPVRGAYIAATPWLLVEHGVGNRCQNSGNEINQPSWDQIAVLFAVRDRSEQGKLFRVQADGSVNTRQHDPIPYQTGKLEYVVSRDAKVTRDVIERLMTQAPKSK